MGRKRTQLELSPAERVEAQRLLRSVADPRIRERVRFALLDLGGQTLQAKLLDMAGLVLNRHGAKIPDGASLGEQITGLRQRYCTRGTQVALGTSAGRSAGGLTLRH